MDSIGYILYIFMALTLLKRNGSVKSQTLGLFRKHAVHVLNHSAKRPYYFGSQHAIHSTTADSREMTATAATCLLSPSPSPPPTMTTTNNKHPQQQQQRQQQQQHHHQVSHHPHHPANNTPQGLLIAPWSTTTVAPMVAQSTPATAAAATLHPPPIYPIPACLPDDGPNNNVITSQHIKCKCANECMPQCTMHGAHSPRHNAQHMAPTTTTTTAVATTTNTHFCYL
jgi:hypothetical protein